MHIYELVSRDRTHPVRIYLLHSEYWTEDEFYNLLLEAFQRSSASDWHLQILEVSKYLVTAHGFVEAGGLQEIGFPGELSKPKSGAGSMRSWARTGATDSFFLSVIMP